MTPSKCRQCGRSTDGIEKMCSGCASDGRHLAPAIAVLREFSHVFRAVWPDFIALSALAVLIAALILMAGGLMPH